MPRPTKPGLFALGFISLLAVISPTFIAFCATCALALGTDGGVEEVSYALTTGVKGALITAIIATAIVALIGVLVAARHKEGD